ncbi:mechanosensitive ion channel [Pedobacter sp. SD-b]|uniref:Mechanosensitive ion channel n=1 Tax=Pedobacter segetis TaxID=2793069 RepID=A0ABS1BIP7_9SPHI|nr:mechanosensitive ion channel domain-containing protein [Pedobacter segetis]MBK0382762.1 mechanosensitive ion channel [Pedobacter segetis]
MNFLDQAKVFLATKGVDFGITLVKAVLVAFIGWQIVKFLSKAFGNLLIKKEIDPSLTVFLKSLVHNGLLILLIFSVLSTLGIEMTSFIAILGAAGLAIGLALQGSLANFAGGVLILVFKPFKVGDVIEAQGEVASVSEIQIFHTVLKTFDNKTIILPNGNLYNNKIINYSTEPARKMQWVFGIGYNDDIDKAKQIIKDVIYADERILDRDTPYIYVDSLGDSSVNIRCRALASNADFWDIYLSKQEEVKKAFDKEGISIPFPQRDVHLYQPKN